MEVNCAYKKLASQLGWTKNESVSAFPKLDLYGTANHATFREKSKISRFPLKPDAGMYPSERTLSFFNHRQQETEKSALTLTLFVPFG